MKLMARTASTEKTAPQTNMERASVQPEPMATVLMVDWPAGVMLQIPAEKPTMHTAAGMERVPAGRAERTAMTTDETTVVVTILLEKLVSTTAQVTKKRTRRPGVRRPARGLITDESQAEMPRSALVRVAPTMVAAAVISTAPHMTPLVLASLNSRICLPAGLARKRMMQPSRGGKAVVSPFTFV